MQWLNVSYNIERSGHNFADARIERLGWLDREFEWNPINLRSIDPTDFRKAAVLRLNAQRVRQLSRRVWRTEANYEVGFAGLEVAIYSEWFYHYLIQGMVQEERPFVPQAMMDDNCVRVIVFRLFKVSIACEAASIV